ncbi:MAG: Y-family DNA polymerase [Thermoguttaceae bacterium]|nr:Y-family DNA polymerase [Thermoguttaceae bacterium]
MSRIIGLVDCDSFFASCEKVFRPDWANRPLVVLSNNDGCVVARSPEAKALGIPMGEPYFKIKSFANSRGVVVRSGNYELYGDMSRRVIQTLSQWTPSVDVYSIDEAFLDLTGRFVDSKGNFRGIEDDPMDGKSLGDIPRQTREELEKLAAEITRIVEKWTGIPVSMGLGPTRTLAKAASRIAKDSAAATGKKYALLFSRRERAQALANLPIEKVWGIGRRLSKTLALGKIETALDFARLDPRRVREDFSIVQEKTLRELRGELMFDVSTPEPQKSLRVSRSFADPISNLEELEKPVANFAAKVAEKLRARKIVAAGLQVAIATSHFNEKVPRRNVAAAANFSKPTNSTPEILSVALRLLRGLFASGYDYKRAGVTALATTDEEFARSQGYLFEPDPTRPQEIRERDRKLCSAMDKINSGFGRDALFFAAQGAAKPQFANASFVSPCYTTDWNSLPVAR